MILVTGATGTVGTEVIAALLPQHADQVRAVTRNPDASFPIGVERIVADLGDSDLSEALADVNAIFCLTDGLHIAQHDRRLASAAMKANVERIVKLSVLGAGHGADDPITALHREGERALRDSGIDWTFLRPTAFMSNALNWAPNIADDQTVHAAFPTGRTAVVDPGDIGAVAAACLTESGHSSAVYELTGPEPLSPPGQVAILGKALGLDLTYVETQPSDARDEMVMYGMPADLADAVVALLHSSHEPFNSEVTSDIATVLGRPPRSFADWCQVHRDAFLDFAGN